MERVWRGQAVQGEQQYGETWRVVHVMTGRSRKQRGARRGTQPWREGGNLDQKLPEAAVSEQQETQLWNKRYRQSSKTWTSTIVPCRISKRHSTRHERHVFYTLEDKFDMWKRGRNMRPFSWCGKSELTLSQQMGLPGGCCCTCVFLSLARIKSNDVYCPFFNSI